MPTEIIKSQYIEIETDLSYAEYPIRILDTKERSTRREKIKMYKVQWNHHTEEEATWETEGVFGSLPKAPQPNLRRAIASEACVW